MRWRNRKGWNIAFLLLSTTGPAAQVSSAWTASVPGASELSLKSSGGVYLGIIVCYELRGTTQRCSCCEKKGCRSCFPVTLAGSQYEPVAAQVELIISQPNNYSQICGWDKVLHQSRPCARSCSQLCRTSGHARWVHMYTHSYTVYVVRIIVSAFCIWNLEHHILHVFREYIVIPDIHIHLYTVCGQMPPFSHIAFLLKGFLCGLHSLQVLTPQTFHKWHKRIHFPQGQPN